LGLDTISLRAIAESEEQVVRPTDSAAVAEEKKSANSDKFSAQKIMPLRENANLLLCTLLLGNVMVNVMIPILLADLTGGLFGFIFSTVFIVIFGEIVPQATCSRYALQIGAASIPLVTFFKCILLPFTVPIAWGLDKCLGKDMGTLYDPTQLERLMTIHMTRLKESGDLKSRECKIIQRGLQLAKTTVAEVMTYQRSVFSLDAEDKLTEEKLIDIWRKGHSRIPVFSHGGSVTDLQRAGYDLEEAEMSPACLTESGLGAECIGLLYAKDLITVRAEDNLTVRQVLRFYARGDPLIVDKEDMLDKVLDEFKRKKVHLALVQEIHCPAGRDPIPERVGIVTLEDVLEHLVGEEFVDEHDVVESVKAQQLRRTRRHNVPIIAFRKLADRTISVEESRAVADYLRATIPAIAALDQRAHDFLPRLLRDGEHTSTFSAFGSDGFSDGPPPAESGAWLYRKNKPLDKFTFVLSGSLTVITGDEGFKSCVSPYQYLGGQVLKRNSGSRNKLADFDAYVQDTARIVQLDMRDLERLESAGADPEGLHGLRRYSNARRDSKNSLDADPADDARARGVPAHRDPAKIPLGVQQFQLDGKKQNESGSQPRTPTTPE